jgi:hypothetical protein
VSPATPAPILETGLGGGEYFFEKIAPIAPVFCGAPRGTFSYRAFASPAGWESRAVISLVTSFVTENFASNFAKNEFEACLIGLPISVACWCLSSTE